MKKIFAVAVAFAAAVVSFFAEATVYRPGLVQGVFQGQGENNVFQNGNNAPVLVKDLFTQTEYTPYKPNEFVYGAIMATGSNANNPWLGTSWSWPDNYSVFAYEGEIYLHAGDIIAATGCFDDGSAMIVSDVTLFEMGADSGYNVEPKNLSTFAAAADGWYPINAYVWDWTGGKNVCKNYSSGIQYNLSGITTNPTSRTIWTHLSDTDGKGSFLRSVSPESFMTLGDLSVSGADVTVAVTFNGVPNDAELWAYSDKLDKGTDLTKWTNKQKIADITAGDTAEAEYMLTGLAGAKALRLCLIRTDAAPSLTSPCTAFYEFSARIFPNMDDPVAEVTRVEPSFTSARVTVEIALLGVGASSAAVTVELADDESFANVLDTETAFAAATTVGAKMAVDFVQLDTNKTYYARAVAVSDVSASSTSAAVEFTTLTPTAGAGSFEITSIGGNSLVFNAKLVDFGLGSFEATLTMECCTDAAFASDVISSEPVKISDFSLLGVDQELSVGGLSSATEYYARLIISNPFGFITRTDAVAYTTTTAVAIGGIGYSTTDSGLTANVIISSFGLDSATLELFANGVSVGSTTITSVGSYGFAVNNMSASIALKAVVTYGESDRLESSVTASRSSASVVVSDPALCANPSDAIVVAVGDKVTFPATIGLQKYVNLSDHRFLKQEDNVFTALEPGMAGVEVYGASGELVSTAMILIRPELQPGGRVFVYDYTKGGQSWNATAWWDVAAKNYTSSPDDPKDIAFVPVLGNDMTFTIDGAYDLQDFFIGRLESNCNGKKVRVNGGQFDPATAEATVGILTIHGIKGKNPRPGKFMICSCAQGTKDNDRWEFNMASYNAKDSWTLNAAENDIEIDLGGPSGNYYPFVGNNDEQAKQKRNSLLLLFDNYLRINIPEGRKVSMVNNSCHREQFQSDNQGWGASDVRLSAADVVRGKGVIEFATPGIISAGKRFFRLFEGEVIDSMRNHVTQFNSNRGGAFWMYDGDFVATNASLTIAGFAMPKQDGISKSTGVYASGNTHGYGGPDNGQPYNGLPSAGVKLNGGTVQIMGYAKENKSAFAQTDILGSDDNMALYESSTLTIGGGLSWITTPTINDVKFPINYVKFNGFAHEDHGTVYFDDGRTRLNPSADAIGSFRDMTEIKGFSDFYVGNTETDTSNPDVFPIVPWAVVRAPGSGNNDFSNIWWAGVDANDWLTFTGGRSGKSNLSEFGDPRMNAFCYSGANSISLALSEDKTLNSLIIQTTTTTPQLGLGRKLTLTSGGLVLNGNNASIGTPGGEDANGTVEFPECAYVWALGTDTSKPDCIWSKIVAPKGFVSTGMGNLFIGGDQTGIDDSIIINSGTLSLGKDDYGCEIDVPKITLAGGGSKLVIAKKDTIPHKTSLEMLCPGGIPGKLVLPEGEIETCFKFYYDGKALPRGEYGPLGSDAQNLCWFITGGKLKVLRDDEAVGFKLHVR